MSHLDPGVLHALLDGEIPSSELAEIQAHLSACAECRARLAEEREIFGEAVELVERLEVPAARPETVPTPRSRRRTNWLTQVAWAASVLMAGGLGYAMRGMVSPGAAPLLRVAAEEGVSTPAADSASPGEAPESPVTKAPAPAESRVPKRARKEPIPEQGFANTSRDAAESQGKAASGTVAAATPPATPPASPLAARPNAAAMPGRLLASRQLRLEEMTVTPSTGQSAGVPIEYPDAVARLGGRLRQIEGLIPRRLEARGDTIRVVYRVGTREVVLVQRRTGGGIEVSLEAPPGFPADSLDLLRALVRD